MRTIAFTSWQIGYCGPVDMPQAKGSAPLRFPSLAPAHHRQSSLRHVAATVDFSTPCSRWQGVESPETGVSQRTKPLLRLAECLLLTGVLITAIIAWMFGRVKSGGKAASSTR